MCHKGTGRGALALGLAIASLAWAQKAPDWRKVGGSSVDLALVSPATGRVDRVWYSPGGSLLYARTRSGKVFETADYETWSPSALPPDPPNGVQMAAVRPPETGARLSAPASDPSHIYALGRQLWRSDDGGRTWTALTARHSRSALGGPQRSVAVSPLDPNQLVVANDYGVWRSMDGGLSWAGLNDGLPNLAIHRILSTPTGTAGTRVQVDGAGVLELTPGSSVWHPVAVVDLVNEATQNAQFSAALGVNIQASAVSGDTVYAGAADGRIWVSRDGGRTFPSFPWQTGGPVERIFVDSAEPRVALAAIGGTGTHILRTTNTGGFWDALDSASLPNAPAHGVTADRAAGAVYAATDKGVFYAHADLENASSDPIVWQRLTDSLPVAAATDVRLDPTGVQLYIALEGHGVYAAAAPHQSNILRILNAADFSTRAAAPGSLVSVTGPRVSAVRGGNLNYPVLSSQDSESQVQVPFEAVGPSVSLALQTAAGIRNMPLAVQPVSPAILLLSRDGVPALYDADSGLPLDLHHPAHSNGRLIIMTTGMGKVRPDWQTGVPGPLTKNPPAVAAQVRAFLDGAPLQVTRATLAGGYVGLYLIEVQLPAVSNPGSSELYLSADGQASNKVQIWIEP